MMLRRILCLILSALMLCACACAAGTASLSQNLLSDWFDNLYLRENIYGDLLWTLDAVDAYLAEPAWDRLQIARMTLSIAENYISLRDLPEMLMTEDGYAALMEQGKDVSFVRFEAAAWQQSRASALNACTILRYGLYDYVFSTQSSNTLAEYAAYVRKDCEFQLEFLGLSTAYLLLNVDDAALRDSFREFIIENCPLVAAEMPEGAQDASSLMAQANEALNAAETFKTDLSKVLGQTQASLNQARDAADTGDMSALVDDAAHIENLPVMLPEPDWFDLETSAFMYYWNGAGGSICRAAEREAIAEIPDGCVIECPGVSEADFLAYVDSLAALSIESFASGDAEGHALYYTLGGASFALAWSQEGAQIFFLEGQICLAPLWYITAAYTGT